MSRLATLDGTGSERVNIGYLMFAAAVMMGATALAVAAAKKLELGSIVALLAVGMALGPHSPLPLISSHHRAVRLATQRA